MKYLWHILYVHIYSFVSVNVFEPAPVSSVSLRYLLTLKINRVSKLFRQKAKIQHVNMFSRMFEHICTSCPCTVLWIHVSQRTNGTTWTLQRSTLSNRLYLVFHVGHRWVVIFLLCSVTTSPTMPLCFTETCFLNILISLWLWWSVLCMRTVICSTYQTW